MNQAIAKCISSCGSSVFFRDFFKYLENDLHVDQCSIFIINHDSSISCPVTRNFLTASIAIPLAETYLKQGYKQDPNISRLKAMSAGQTSTIHLDEFIQKISPSYRSQFFSNPGLVDKVSILAKRSCNSYYINLYRAMGKRLFREDKLFLEHEGENIVSALVTKHYSIDSALLTESPLVNLSERERQVCKGILSGKKTEAIAFELGLTPSSIITYRRRAYQKLAINSRSALFALCENN